jgi:hypothetical protein
MRPSVGSWTFGNAFIEQAFTPITFGGPDRPLMENQAQAS